VTTVLDVTRFAAGLTTTRVFAAYHDDGWRDIAGVLTIDEKYDTVELVYVREDCQRQGVASQLLAHAREATGLALAHDAGDRSLEGSAWCRANGIRVKPGNVYRRLAAREAKGYGARLMMRLPLTVGAIEQWDKQREAS
jgi:GNAT superfamily N-acetyltransferase